MSKTENKLSICSNRLFVSVGIIAICYAIKAVFVDIDVDSTRQWVIATLVKDASSITIGWIGLLLIFDKEESDEQ